MADNTTLNSGSGGDIIKTEDTGAGFKIPVSKIYTGAADVNGGPVTTANPFPTQPQSGSLISLLVGGQINTPANPVPTQPQSGSITGLLVGGVAASKANPLPTLPQSGSLTAILIGGNTTPVSFSNPFPISGSVGIQIGGVAATLANPVPVTGSAGVLIGGVAASLANPVPITGTVGQVVGGVAVSLANPLPVAFNLEGGGQILSGTTTNVVQFFTTNVATSGSTQLIAPQAGQGKIRVLALNVMANGTVMTNFLSTGSAGTVTAISAYAPLVVNGGYTLPHNPHGWFQTKANEGLNVALNAGVNVGITLTWMVA